jgi:subtilisin family serine protease
MVRDIETLIYGNPEQRRRFTQDFPVLPDVWIAYAENLKKTDQPKKKDRLELLLTPHNRSDAATLTRALRQRFEEEKTWLENYRRSHSSTNAEETTSSPRILFNESVVFASFTFEELVRLAMPLTDWWKWNVADAVSEESWSRDTIRGFVRLVTQSTSRENLAGGDPRLLAKLISIVGAIECNRNGIHEESADDPNDRQDEQDRIYIPQAQVDAFCDLLEGLSRPNDKRGLLYNVSKNREAKTSIWRSRMAIKADAATRLFEVDTADICWAILDVGIDARHKAFARRKGNQPDLNDELDENGAPQFGTRVTRTYDFLRYKQLVDRTTQPEWKGSYAETLAKQEREKLIKELQVNLDSGRSPDWSLLEPFLRIPHLHNIYDKYDAKIKDSHGTHVAGIMAANWPEAKDTALERELYGICPNLELYDVRVLGKDNEGNPADEFTIMSALQFLRYVNSRRQSLMAIHGVNLSMSVVHEVANYACGRTPICEECERVVASGMVVVTAAGNRGFNKLASPADGAMGDYRYISITDPGNAQSVITVGSTHRFMPHNYGVSYFSSRGPTGDGRTKPDLVAPGEKIDSCSRNNNFETMDGTSMAAPHVSGAAVLLIARHRELVGQPTKIKEILCKSATDLGREPRFQGAGMLDVLRALQSV